MQQLAAACHCVNISSQFDGVEDDLEDRHVKIHVCDTANNREIPGRPKHLIILGNIVNVFNLDTGAVTHEFRGPPRLWQRIGKGLRSASGWLCEIMGGDWFRGRHFYTISSRPGRVPKLSTLGLRWNQRGKSQVTDTRFINNPTNYDKFPPYPINVRKYEALGVLYRLGRAAKPSMDRKIWIRHERVV